jgi:hypothetical protein
VGIFNTPLVKLLAPEVPVTVKLLKVAAPGVGMFNTPEANEAAPVPVVVKLIGAWYAEAAVNAAVPNVPPAALVKLEAVTPLAKVTPVMLAAATLPALPVVFWLKVGKVLVTAVRSLWVKASVLVAVIPPKPARV